MKVFIFSLEELIVLYPPSPCHSFRPENIDSKWFCTFVDFSLTLLYFSAKNFSEFPILQVLGIVMAGVGVVYAKPV